MNLWNLEGTNVRDWGFNISYGEKWSDVVKALKAMKYGPLILKLKRAGKLTGKDIEKLRDGASYIYTGVTTSKADPFFVTLDIGGGGLELSLHYLEGKLEWLT